jgi:dihydrofolate reductase
MISLIAAVDKNGGIGSGGRPLWTGGLPADSQRFRELTAGSSVIMGRKAFESFHGILPGRQNIVVSHRFMVHEDITFAHSLEEAYREATSRDINVIGGANIFSQAIRDADRIYITQVDEAFDNVDAYFPIIDKSEWREAKREDFKADGRNIYDYSFIVYERIRV